MAEVHATARVERTVSEVFAYLADFSNTARWDPGVAEASQLGSGPLEVGTGFSLVLRIGPFRVPVTYEIVALEQDRRVVLETRGRAHVGRDEVTVTAAVDGVTLVEWDAAFSLRGPGRLLDPLLKVGFRSAATQAMRGLVTELGGTVLRS